MRKFLQMLLPLLLTGTMVLGMVACTPSTPEQPDEETNGSTESGTQPDAEDTTAADTPDVPDGEVVKAVREQLTFDAAVTIAEQDGGARDAQGRAELPCKRLYLACRQYAAFYHGVEAYV